MTRWALVAVLAFGAVTAGCGDDTPTAPSTPTTPTLITRTFEGTIEPGQARFFSFNTTQSGTLSATFSSLSLIGRVAALPLAMQIGVGVPAGEGCAVTQSADIAPALTTQFTMTVTAATTYCVNIADPGTLPAAAAFSIRFSHP
jgi:hypothetical protein